MSFAKQILCPADAERELRSLVRGDLQAKTVSDLPPVGPSFMTRVCGC
jgi:hypothetical protein